MMKRKKNYTASVLSFGGVILAIVMLVLSRGLNYTAKLNYAVYGGEILALLLLGGSYLINKRYRQEMKSKKALLAPFIFPLLVLVGMITGVFSQYTFFRLIELYLLFSTILTVAGYFLRIAGKSGSPSHAMLLSFVSIIFFGSLLLILPGMHRGNISITDAVFTATSAVCVTGLSVCDSAVEFTHRGQWVILFLIQIGGLGIMIFGALFAVILGSKLSLKETAAMRDTISEQDYGNITQKIVFICFGTFAIEAIGMLLLFTVDLPKLTGTYDRFFFALFHSVSSFCNAGFSLQSDSLTSLRYSWQPYLIICPLVVAGGIGFPVLFNLAEIVKYQIITMFHGRQGKLKPRLSLHSKLVLLTTAALLIGGTALLLLAAFAGGQSKCQIELLDCFFNSVTARTAGFNTVDIANLNPASKLVLIGLMNIGGSPASTAGGIKTIAVAIMFLTIFATISNTTVVHVFNRSITVPIVRRSLVLMAVYVLLFWLVTFLLFITEAGKGHENINLSFEAASALGTVGLSAGVTPTLSTAGKWIIIFSMLAGRLGPLTLMTAMTFKMKKGIYSYPPEPVVIW